MQPDGRVGWVHKLYEKETANYVQVDYRVFSFLCTGIKKSNLDAEGVCANSKCCND